MSQNISHSINLFIGTNRANTDFLIPQGGEDINSILNNSNASLSSLGSQALGMQGMASQNSLFGLENNSLPSSQFSIPNSAENKGSSIFGLVKETLTGLIPGLDLINDIKDTFSSLKGIFSGDKGSILDLGKSIIGWIPGIGNFAKGLLKSMNLDKLNIFSKKGTESIVDTVEDAFSF